jgi:hypothetical protein
MSLCYTMRSSGWFASNEKMGESIKKLHLKIPDAIFGILQPTGCRNSKEAEATWLLEAAIDVARELQTRGVLPIMRDSVPTHEQNSHEIHIPLCQDDIDFLTDISKKEGGSRGKLVRELLFAAHTVAHDCRDSLTHIGLVAKLREFFAE